MSTTASRWLARARQFLGSELWDAEPERGSRLFVIRLLQFGIVVAQGFVRDRLLLRASALSYFTVISVIPLIAVAVAIAGAVGVGGQDFASWVVGTIAAGSPEAQGVLARTIERTSFAGIGTISASVLFVTTVLAISNVERSLNDIWGVPKGRSLMRRFPDYLAVLIVGPLLVGVAISLSTTLHSEWLVSQLLEYRAFATLHEFGLRQVPWAMLSLSFAFLYWFLPNTRVRPASALLGAVPAGLLTLAAQSVYLDFSLGAVRANLFYGSLAWLPLLFVWIYVFWAIVLFGAEMAFAHQNLQTYRREVRGAPASPAQREAIALRLALSVARRFRDGAGPLDADELADSLTLPARTVRDLIHVLVAQGILSLCLDGEREDAVQLGRPAERIRVTDVLVAVRGQRELAGGDPSVGGAVARLLAELDEAVRKGASGRTLADLIDALSPPPGVDPLADAG